MQQSDAASRLSVVVITLNEENNIENCIRSLPSGSEIILVDSGSTDRTPALAAAMGARVHNRKFTDYSEQKNAAIALATRPWVLSVDADEQLTPDLVTAICKVVTREPSGSAAFRVKRRLYFMGRAMRFGRTVDYPLRLFPRGSGEFQNAIHEEYRHSGPVELLAGGEMLHFSYRNLSDYFDRFNRYTSAIAHRRIAKGIRMESLLLICFRPFAEFISRYFLRLGFLDGYPGFVYALCSSLYAFIKHAKHRELVLAGKSPS